MLFSNIPDTECQSRHKGNDHNGHNSFKVYTVSDVRTAFCYSVWNKKEGLKGIKSRVQETQFATLAEGWLNFFNKIQK